MARPYPYPCSGPAGFAWGPRSALCLALIVATGCNSDEPLDTTTGIDLTTGMPMTEVHPFTTGIIEEATSTGEYDDPDQSCRTALECIVPCALSVSNPGPEEDLSCFRNCIEGMTTAEWLALIDLGICVYEGCRAMMTCTDHGVDDDEKCRSCVLNGMLDLVPIPGCEAEAMACK